MDGNNINNQNQQSYNQEADYQQVNQQYNQQQHYQQQYEMQQQYYQQLYEQQQAQQAGQQYAGQQEQQAYQQYAQQPQYDQPQQQYIQPQTAAGNNDGNSTGGNGGKKKTGLIIGIIAAVVVIAAAIIIAIVLKNKKDKKDNDKKTTNEVTTAEGGTTGDVTSEEVTTEETTEEAAGVKYYKLVNIENGEDVDYVSLIEELNAEGMYNYAVLDFDNKTGYIVVAGEKLGSDFNFEDNSFTMDGEKADMDFDGDNLTISYYEEKLYFEPMTYEEFAAMEEAINSVIVMNRGETTTEDIVFPYEDIKVTIPEGFTLLGNIDSSGYTDDIHCQKSVDGAGVVASYFVYVDWWNLAENGKTIQDCVDEWGFANDYETVDFQSDNGFDIYWLGRADKPSEYMSDGFSDGNGESKYCHMIEYFGYFEAGGNAYGLTLYIDADYYGADADNVAMEILNGLSYR